MGIGDEGAMAGATGGIREVLVTLGRMQRLGGPETVPGD